ncbi:MAG TPA: metallophosphoesterase, partial [Cyclobacteriaceae bacterium]|nr:metallophosphoesterase [Cyclobacteriaceae bacterium]
MRFERKKMVNWYDPEQLAYTATKTVISGIFGNFADRREMQAALDPKLEPHDLSDKSEVWIDYISDLGDGFDATYTMAHLMAQNQLVGNGEVLSRGDILIMGGDQVYPTPELEEYDNRLKGPYNAAYPWVENDGQRPSLFALPGNHDWYDGLTNFLRLFCQGRSLGNWHSKQRRSYFAIK